MKFVIQRVKQASVTVEGKTISEIGPGFLVLIGVGKEDTKEIADGMIRKMLGLRIFADENGKTNLSLKDTGGRLLLVSQFTLCANCRKGNRPGFSDAAGAELAASLYEYILAHCEAQTGESVGRGIFGADMEVSLVNDGPFTILLDSCEIL